MRKRRLIVGAIVVIVLLATAAYVGAGVVIYNRLTAVTPHCSEDLEVYANTPAHFNALEGLDSTPYLIPEYEDVSFSSRGSDLQIAAWWIEAGSPEPEDAPTVILVHGLGGCRRTPTILLAAGMLHRNSFNTLLIDLRDQGDSQIEDGRYAGGTEEYLDVLGAWDWLVNNQGIAPERIGLYGTSLGAATALIAAGEEPRVAAVWEDSSYADLHVAVQAELDRNGYPTFLADSAAWIGKLIAGDDLGAFSPLKAVEKLNGRPLYVTHGGADARLSVQYADALAQAASTDDNPVSPWIIPNADHVRGMFLQPEAYEHNLVEFFQASLGASQS